MITDDVDVQIANCMMYGIRNISVAIQTVCAHQITNAGDNALGYRGKEASHMLESPHLGYG